MDYNVICAKDLSQSLFNFINTRAFDFKTNEIRTNVRQTTQRIEGCDVSTDNNPPSTEIILDGQVCSDGIYSNSVTVDVTAVDDGDPKAASATTTKGTSLLSMITNLWDIIKDVIFKAYAGAIPLPDGITDIFYRVDGGERLQYKYA